MVIRDIIIYDKQKRKDLEENEKIKIIVPKRKKRKRKRKNQKQKLKKKNKKKKKIIRHSKRMKNGLRKRIIIEHINSIIHRSFKRLSHVYEKYIRTFDAYIKMAISIILINKMTIIK